MAFIRTAAAISAIPVSFAALLYKALVDHWDKIQNVHGEKFRSIPDTLYCDDIALPRVLQSLVRCFGGEARESLDLIFLKLGIDSILASQGILLFVIFVDHNLCIVDV